MDQVFDSFGITLLMIFTTECKNYTIPYKNIGGKASIINFCKQVSLLEATEIPDRTDTAKPPKQNSVCFNDAYLVWVQSSLANKTLCSLNNLYI